MSTPPAPPDPAEHYDKAVTNYRETAKWILSVFAAIAGVLLAGLQLSNLGKADAPYLTIAAIAAAFALGAVGAIIWLATTVLASGVVTETSLRAYPRTVGSKDINLNDKLLLDGYDTVVAFLDDYTIIGAQYEQARKNNDQATVTRLTPKIKQLVQTRSTLLPIARYAIVLRSFNVAMRWMFVCGIVAAIAIGVFAWATNQKSVTNTIFQEPPSTAAVTLTTTGQAALKDSLGADCVAQPQVAVILLSVADGKFEVVTIPSNICQVAKFTVDADTGTVQSSP
jgi:hypothetical protein